MLNIIVQESRGLCSETCAGQFGCECPNGEHGMPVYYARDDLRAVSDYDSIQCYVVLIQFELESTKTDASHLQTI